MIHENIKRFRKEKGISQDEMAAKLHVVRQTVSKWEKGLSTPDADLLIPMAELLEVSVYQLLGIEEKQQANYCEITALQEELEKRTLQEAKTKQASRQRGVILRCSFVASIAALSVENAFFSMIVSGGLVLFAVSILYRNLALLTDISMDDAQTKAFRVTTLFDATVLIVTLAFAMIAVQNEGCFSEETEKFIAMTLIVCVIAFAGAIAPRLPFSQHTGLRLPWTVQDGETWVLAHRILGYLSLPIALLYTACALVTESFEAVTLIAIVLWLGIPAIFSLVFFQQKHRKWR